MILTSYFLKRSKFQTCIVILQIYLCLCFQVGDYDAATQKILEQIDQVQSEIDSLNEKASEEILKASFRNA